MFTSIGQWMDNHLFWSLFFLWVILNSRTVRVYDGARPFGQRWLPRRNKMDDDENKK